MALMLRRRIVSCCCPGKHTNLSSCHIPPAGLPVTVLPAKTMITFVTENKCQLKIARDFKGWFYPSFNPSILNLHLLLLSLVVELKMAPWLRAAYKVSSWRPERVFTARLFGRWKKYETENDRLKSPPILCLTEGSAFFKFSDEARYSLTMKSNPG